jgi:epoxyqueuosine reductase QueG
MDLKSIFSAEGIEYFAALDIKSLNVVNERLLERSALTPKSVIVFLIPYYGGGADNLSVYSASKDYHLYIKELNSRLIPMIKKIYPDANLVGFGDHSPIDERHAAVSAGLGVIGKNGLLINEKYGTFVFIADIITDIEPDLIGASEVRDAAFCEGCGLCLDACPTGILTGKGECCLSEVTQKKGELSDAEKELVLRCGSVWGCDACQLSCPHNASPILTPIKFFKEDRIEKLDLETLDAMTEEQFSERAYAWRGRKTVRRNLLLFKEKNSDKTNP